ncbi:TPA: hypothetical protein N0F65_006231 [Lagenidium giganteum]|uniref:Endonuclease III homolog n=1 Tax=Lagenidium giganteum TaxID=4803 RepID=A0AAV2Z5K3_9STRA|nr:TPA: hypothetical protein N0F65_006231 [Lagenidium giganteum]
MHNPFARFAHKKAVDKDGETGAATASVPAPPTTTPVATDNDDARQERPIKRRKTGDITAPVKHEQLTEAPRSTSTDTRHSDEDTRLALLVALQDARKNTVAPIDQYGTQACVHPETTDPRARRFQILVASMLSSQTKDQVTYEAMQRLHAIAAPMKPTMNAEEAVEPGLTIAKARNASEETLAEVLRPVGFYRRKVTYLKALADTCDHQFNGDIPATLSALTSLPGVGPKIARVVLLLAWDRVDGIIVDTHVHRFSKRLHWVSSDSSTPEDTRKQLEEWVPRSYWGGMSRAVVGFGQTTCLPVAPKCTYCPLAPICPSVQRVKATSSAREVTGK